MDYSLVSKARPKQMSGGGTSAAAVAATSALLEQMAAESTAGFDVNRYAPKAGHFWSVGAAAFRRICNERMIICTRNAPEIIEATPASQAIDISILPLKADLVASTRRYIPAFRFADIEIASIEQPTLDLTRLVWGWMGMPGIVHAHNFPNVFTQFQASGSDPEFDIDIQLRLAPARPPLRQRLAPRIAYLESLRPGWDGYDAAPPSKDTLGRLVADLETALGGLDAVAPTLVPGADGSLQAEWRRKGFTVFYDVGADGERTLLVRNKQRGIDLLYEGDEAAAELESCAKDLLT